MDPCEDTTVTNGKKNAEANETTTDTKECETKSMDFKYVKEDISDVEHGKYVGNCKWFNKKVGYGFITAYEGEYKGVNVFVHHSGIKPLNSNFRTLRKGEYVSFDIVEGKNLKRQQGQQGQQGQEGEASTEDDKKSLHAINVTGVYGGPLMCDNHFQRPSSIVEKK